MRKLCGVVITALALAALPVLSSAQGTTKKTTAPATQKAAEPKLLDASGSVSAVTTDSLTVTVLPIGGGSVDKRVSASLEDVEEAGRSMYRLEDSSDVDADIGGATPGRDPRGAPPAK
jgi:hypothetical protein